MLSSQLSAIRLTAPLASGLLGRQVRKVFELDGWKAVGTGLTRISPPEIIRLDIINPNDVAQVLDEVKYGTSSSIRSRR